MKKILKFLRNCLVFVIWTSLFIFIFKTLIYLVWSFDITSVKSWQTILQYWNQGGVFKTAPDIILLFLLLLLPFIYFIGFIKAKRINYIKSISSFFGFFFREKDEEPERIVIKGMKTTQQMINEVKNELESLKPEKNKEAGNIRSNILKKINEEIKK